MKRLLMLIPLVLLCCPGCQQGEEAATVDVEADIQAIKYSVAELNEAFNSADIDTIMSIYADDAVRIPPNEPATIGKEALQEGVYQLLDFLTEFNFQEKFFVEDVKVSGNLAIAYLSWSGIYIPKTGGEEITHSGNWIMGFEKQSDGVWKIIYSIWSDEELINPDLPE